MANDKYDWIDDEHNLKLLHGHLVHIHDTLTGREIASDDTVETNAEMINALTEVIRNHTRFLSVMKSRFDNNKARPVGRATTYR